MTCDELLAELEADPYRPDYPLRMLIEDIVHFSRTKDERQALTKHAMERCRDLSVKVAMVPGGASLTLTLGDQEMAVVIPRETVIEASILLMRAVGRESVPADG
jgi:hypothetical protein